MTKGDQPAGGALGHPRAWTPGEPYACSHVRRFDGLGLEAASLRDVHGAERFTNPRHILTVVFERVCVVPGRPDEFGPWPGLVRAKLAYLPPGFAVDLPAATMLRSTAVTAMAEAGCLPAGDGMPAPGQLRPLWVDAGPAVLAAGHALARLARDPPSGGRLLADSALAVAFAEVASRLGAPERRAGALPPATARACLDYLDANLGREVRLAELAALTALSPAHLCRAFKASTGLSPHRWQLGRRIDAACVRLARGGEAVADIAVSLGFVDAPHFTRVFKQHVGTTPARFRGGRG